MRGPARRRSIRPPARAVLGVLLACPAAAQGAGAAGDPTAVETVARFPEASTRLALRDFDADGDLDLLRLTDAGATVARLGPDGRFDVGRFAEERLDLTWPAGRVGWDLTDLDGDGAAELSLLLEEGVVRTHRLAPSSGGGEAAGFGEGEVVLEHAAWLPRGVSRVRFARDVDGDGFQDLVLPGPGAHEIFLAHAGSDGDGPGYGDPVRVEYELDAELRTGDPGELSGRIGQDVRVPWFRIEDVDGDGRQDLVAETGERVAFHLATPRIASEPTWTLDLGALRAELPARSGVDFDDLFSALDQTVSWRIVDLDGAAPKDLLLQIGPKFRVYLGGAAAGPGATPDQVLKSSGNVLWSFVRQVGGTPLADLQIVRAERVSIGRVVRSLILPSALTFDLYTYENEGGSFSRKPTRRNSLRLEVPRLLSFVEDAEGFGESLEAQAEIPAVRLPRVPGAPAEGDAVVDVEGQALGVYPGCAPPALLAEEVQADGVDVEGLIEAYFLRDFDERGDGAERTLDLADLLDLDLATGAVLRKRRQGRTPVLTIPLAFPADDLQELRVADLDRDGSADVVAVAETEDGWVVQILVLR